MRGAASAMILAEFDQERAELKEGQFLSFGEIRETGNGQ
jgi:hypothetical protein